MGGAIKCTLNAIFDWNDFWSPVVICFSFPFAFLFPSARKERDWDRRAVQTVLVTPITVFGVPFLIWAKVLLHLSACCIYLAFPYSTFLLVVDFILVPSSHDCDVDWETRRQREKGGKWRRQRGLDCDHILFISLLSSGRPASRGLAVSRRRQIPPPPIHSE